MEKNKNTMILGKNIEYSLDTRKTGINNNVLVVGASGTGKTRGIVIPNILQAAGSYIVLDPKGNLYQKHKAYLEKKGYIVKKLDFTDPIRSDHYNPLEYIENSQDIVKISHMLIYGDGGYRRVSPFWDESSQMLLQSNRIDEAVAGETRMFCNILRDADKVDILRVNVETTMEEIYNVSEVELLTSGVSEKVMDQVREHHAVNRDVMDSPAEHLIGHIALAFELVYPKSWEIAKEQGYIYKMFDFPSRNESTLKALEDTREELKVFYGDVS